MSSVSRHYSKSRSRLLPRRLLPVLSLVVRGRRNKEIADELTLGRHTVENYVSELLLILDCRSRVELTIRFRDYFK
ncbi:MAG: response regulator transcription factor [Tepidiformaceae bacterium]